MKELAPVIPNSGGMLEVQSNRQIQEVQAAVISAKRFPRDEVQAHKRIMTACSRKGLAEVAMYSYPRGGQNVTGPSIRLAEALAQAWGNIDAGWSELERKPPIGNLPGESLVLAYAVDLETNYRKPLTFTVRHWRDTKQGGYAIKEERDIYELVANQASRRLRACILGVIPRDVQEDAIAKCEETLKNDKEPLIDRIKKMVVAFGDMGVSQEMLEKRLGHKMEATTDTELVTLRKVWTSIKDGFATREEFFEVPPATTPVDNKGDAPTPPAAEPKSVRKAVKNHAPQTSEEAKARQAAKTEQRDSEPDQSQAAPAKSEEPKQPLSKVRLTQDIIELSKRMKWDSATLTAKFAKLVNKAPGQCTAEELDSVLTLLKVEEADATKQ